MKWPDKNSVLNALKQWIDDQQAAHPELLKLGYFGSYARGDWGVGSDLDLVAVVEFSDKDINHRTVNWELDSLPVPVELLIFTLQEWEAKMSSGDRFSKTLQEECVWVYLKQSL